MENDYTKLISAVRAFCLMIDYLETYQPVMWLREMNHLLAQIEAGMKQLDLEAGYSFFVLPDLDWRFSMFCRLKEFLGEWDAYALAGECGSDPEEFTGSLADDFTDLYFELRRGLDLYDAGDGDLLSALTLWRTGFVLHWDRHLAEARRRLDDLYRQRVL